SSWPTSRPGTSTPGPAPRSSASSAGRSWSSARRWSWSPTTPSPPATPTPPCSWPTAGSSTSSKPRPRPASSTGSRPWEADVLRIATGKRRLVGTMLAVLLGVSFLAGTLALSDTLRSNFADLFAAANSRTDVVVRSADQLKAGGDAGPGMSQRGLLDASLVNEVAAVPGVADAVADVQGYGQILGANGKAVGGNGPPRLAGVWITDPDLNPYRLVEGRAPSASDEVVINRGAAKAGHLEVGDTTIVETP